MTKATWAVEVDWGDTELYDHASADITGDVIEFTAERGRNFPSQLTGRAIAGKATVLVRNDDGKYSPKNTGSPVAGLLEPGRRLRLRTTAPVAKTIWTGFVDRFEPVTVNKVAMTRITALGPLAQLTRRVNIAPLTNVTAKTVLDAILDDAGWPKVYDQYLLNDIGSVLAYWRLGEASGDAADSSGNGHTATASGTGPYGVTGGIDDPNNTCVTFNGFSGYFDAGAPAAFDVTNNFTVAFWIKISGVPAGFYDPVSYAHDGSTGWVMQGNVAAFDAVFQPAGSASFGDLRDSAWHFCVATKSSTTGIIAYVDGVQNAQNAGATGAVTLHASREFNIGRDPIGRFFVGEIDEVSFHDKVWSAAEVASAYARGLNAPRHLDTGQTTFNRKWFWDKNALNACREVEDSELGFLYEDASGAIVFEDRHHRWLGAHLTKQATYSDAPAASIPYVSISQADPARDIYNHARAMVRAYTVQTLAVLWTLSETTDPTLAPGETRTWWAQYPPAGTPDGRYVDAWTAPDSSDVTVTGVVFGDLGITVSKFAQSMKIAITNNGSTTATLTLLRARGTAVTEDDPTIVEAEDAALGPSDERRSYPLPAKWLPDTAVAQNYVDYVVSRYKDPVPLLTAAFAPARDSTGMTEVLTREISDRVEVVAANDSQLGMTLECFVEGIKHRVREGAYRHDTIYQLGSADPQVYATWDDGKWDEARWGF